MPILLNMIRDVPFEQSPEMIDSIQRNAARVQYISEDFQEIKTRFEILSCWGKGRSIHNDLVVTGPLAIISNAFLDSRP